MSKQDDEEEEALQRQRKLLGTLVVCLIGLIYTEFKPHPHPIVPDAMLCVTRLKSTAKVIKDYAAKNNRLPLTISDVEAAIAAAKCMPVVMVPRAARPIPDAIVYDFDGSHYTLQVYDQSGRPIEHKGEVLEVQVP